MSRVDRRAAAVALILGAAFALASTPVSAQLLARPWRCATCISNYFYFDHNAGSGVDDWNCGSSTYNAHDAADFSLRGGVTSIATGYAVLAAADGDVIRAVDGNYDRCQITGLADCASGTRCTYDTANYVVIRHADKTTRYVHLRNGSVRVAVGDHVTCGQVIAEIGSSGCSTNAHLHFEVRARTDAAASAYDPFRGTCSARPASAWVMQGPYRGYPGAECEMVVPPPVDAGVPMPDAGVTSDAGAPVAPDAGGGVPDAGAGVPDAGASADAAPPSGSDGAVRAPDAGRGMGGDLSGGCGCRAGTRGDTPALPLFALAILGAWWMRRLRRSPRT